MSDARDPQHIADPVAVARRVLKQEAEALTTLAAALGAAFVEALTLLLDCKGRVVVTGIGKSGHVGRKIASTFASTGTKAVFVHAAEAGHGDLGMIDGGDVVLALSRNGESRELSDIIAYAHRFRIPLIAITAAPDSTLGKAASVILALPDLPEATAAVGAPTTSTTMQLALGDALAVALLESRGFDAQRFSAFHPGGKLGAMLRTVKDLMHGPPELPLVGMNQDMRSTLVELTRRAFGCAGVVDQEGALVGIITDGDIRRHIDDDLLDASAGAIMTRAPVSVAPDTLAGDALRILNERKILVLFVVEDGRPVGIIHAHDLLRAGVL